VSESDQSPDNCDETREDIVIAVVAAAASAPALLLGRAGT
jgi:hypothetical protein